MAITDLFLNLTHGYLSGECVSGRWVRTRNRVRVGTERHQLIIPIKENYYCYDYTWSVTRLVKYVL